MVLFNPKLKTLYVRDPKTHKVSVGEFTDERHLLVGRWLVTEKMDGTSVILSTERRGYEYFGRTEKSQFTSDLHHFLDNAASYAADRLYNASIDQADIYAELVGPGIQGNPHGFEEVQLFVFDVRIGDFWLDWHNVEDIAKTAGLQTAPAWDFLTGRETVMNVLRNPGSFDWKTFPRTRTDATTDYLEGFVARTDPYLYDNQGNRIMWKLKCSDFPKA